MRVMPVGDSAAPQRNGVKEVKGKQGVKEEKQACLQRVAEGRDSNIE